MLKLDLSTDKRTGRTTSKTTTTCLLLQLSGSIQHFQTETPTDLDETNFLGKCAKSI